MSEVRHPPVSHTHFQGTHDAILGDREGTIKSANAWSLTDTDQDWWAYWYSGGELRVESGTATAAGSTFIEDSTKISGAANCTWAADRFDGFASPWQGFIVEIDHAGVTYKLPIISANPATGRITFASVGASFSIGDAWRIREPDSTLNRYAGKTVKISPAAGKPFTLSILYSDRHTLFFDPDELAKKCPGGLQRDWSYAIQEFYPGGVYIWTIDDDDNGIWQKVSGFDSRHGVNFKVNPEQNAPDKVKSFGIIRKGDYRSIDTFSEIYCTLNALRWTPGGLNWINQGEENAFFEGLVGGNETWSPDPADGGTFRTYDEAWAQQLSNFASSATPFTFTASGHPNASLHSFSEDAVNAGASADPGKIGAVKGDLLCQRGYFYPQVTGVPTLMSSEVDFFCYTAISALDPDEGPDPDWPDRIENHFDAQGTNLKYREWVDVDSVTSSSATRTGSRVGNATGDTPAFTQPQDPLPHSSSGTPNVYATSQVQSGYEVIDQATVLKWDMKFLGPWKK
jgi:hypothetical protein